MLKIQHLLSHSQSSARCYAVVKQLSSALGWTWLNHLGVSDRLSQNDWKNSPYDLPLLNHHLITSKPTHQSFLFIRTEAFVVSPTLVATAATAAPDVLCPGRRSSWCRPGTPRGQRGAPRLRIGWDATPRGTTLMMTDGWMDGLMDRGIGR